MMERIFFSKKRGIENDGENIFSKKKRDRYGRGLGPHM